MVKPHRNSSFKWAKTGILCHIDLKDETTDRRISRRNELRADTSYSVCEHDYLLESGGQISQITFWKISLSRPCRDHVGTLIQMANMLVRPSKLSKILIIIAGCYSINGNAIIFYSHWLRRSLEDKLILMVQTRSRQVQTRSRQRFRQSWTRKMCAVNFAMQISVENQIAKHSVKS